MPQESDTVAIIGAGISGLTLALSLHSHRVLCTVFEMRNAEHEALNKQSLGPIMLSPNAIRIYDRLKIYERIKPLGFGIEGLTFSVTTSTLKNGDVGIEKCDSWLVGNEELYGYRALRLMRQRVLMVLRDMVQECDIKIQYEKRFSSIVSESDYGVQIAFEDGSRHSARFVVGADGIWSSCRPWVLGEKHAAEPVWSGGLAISATVESKAISLPRGEAWELPAIITSSAGFFGMIPYDAGGNRIQIMRQWPWPHLSKEGFKELAADKEGLAKKLREDLEAWPRVVQEALNHFDSAVIWPFFSLPRLGTWMSENRQVVLIGDAAHAIPPMAGQGACQGIEDAWTLANVLASCFGSNRTTDMTTAHEPTTRPSLHDALDTWQQARSERVARVAELTIQLNSLRLPLKERDKLGLTEEFWRNVMGRNGELAWLYGTGKAGQCNIDSVGTL